MTHTRTRTHARARTLLLALALATLTPLAALAVALSLPGVPTFAQGPLALLLGGHVPRGPGLAYQGYGDEPGLLACRFLRTRPYGVGYGSMLGDGHADTEYTYTVAVDAIHGQRCGMWQVPTGLRLRHLPVATSPARAMPAAQGTPRIAIPPPT